MGSYLTGLYRLILVRFALIEIDGSILDLLCFQRFSFCLTHFRQTRMAWLCIKNNNQTVLIKQIITKSENFDQRRHNNQQIKQV